MCPKYQQCKDSAECSFFFDGSCQEPDMSFEQADLFEADGDCRGEKSDEFAEFLKWWDAIPHRALATEDEKKIAMNSFIAGAKLCRR